LFSTPTTPVYNHLPVLLKPILEALAWPEASKDGLWVDATLGLGGHSKALIERLGELGKQPHWLGLDRDEEALAHAKARLEAELPATALAHWRLVKSEFSKLPQALGLNVEASLEEGQQPITGALLADLGVSSLQLDKGSRGFSFREDAPLDMRMGGANSNESTAANLLAQWNAEQLANCFYNYGEERLSRPIARAIVWHRENVAPLETTLQLANLLENEAKRKGLWPPRRDKKRDKAPQIHPATRVFQALRIAVNHELDELESLLAAMPLLMAPGARVGIISFHSLEDRLVKHWFLQAAKTCICPPTWPVCQCSHKPLFRSLSKKAIIATEEERNENPRSRSAKLRLYERI
jgi:16S rRNA (cytosine1402-N4)-methyltransferase